MKTKMTSSSHKGFKNFFDKSKEIKMTLTSQKINYNFKTYIDSIIGSHLSRGTKLPLNLFIYSYITFSKEFILN